MSGALSFFGMASGSFGVWWFLVGAFVLIVIVLGVRALCVKSIFIRREKKKDFPHDSGHEHARKMNKGDPCPYCQTGILGLKLPRTGRKADRQKRCFLLCPNCFAVFRLG